jgi:molybdopterin adenylyltransferase
MTVVAPNLIQHMQITVGIITISDRAAAGEYGDLGGPALKEAAEKYGWQVLAEAIVPDEISRIRETIRSFSDQGCGLVLATGGTGIAERDVTPEAIRGVMRVELPGFGETMRRESMKITPNAILSRSLAAVVERSLVLALPGKPSGAVECLGFVAGAIPHAVALAQRMPTSC